MLLCEQLTPPLHRTPSGRIKRTGGICFEHLISVRRPWTFGQLIGPEGPRLPGWGIRLGHHWAGTVRSILHMGGPASRPDTFREAAMMSGDADGVKEVVVMLTRLIGPRWINRDHVARRLRSIAAEFGFDFEVSATPTGRVTVCRLDISSHNLVHTHSYDHLSYGRVLGSTCLPSGGHMVYISITHLITSYGRVLGSTCLPSGGHGIYISITRSGCGPRGAPRHHAYTHERDAARDGVPPLKSAGCARGAVVNHI